ncbi:hypothetical protein RF11_12071 [Thelohanellus kitauei]|uniref:Uncharacterized protein n=1 Tax=Thelohanellus kitauei TaxID=669202 RepID=A0A0C2ITN0_THEKT|nr:hypothetical protein RF11_12071 [Thelohanellus kitauei]
MLILTGTLKNMFDVLYHMYQFNFEATVEPQASFNSKNIIYPCESAGPNYTYEVVESHDQDHEKSSDTVKTIPVDEELNVYICCPGVCVNIDRSLYDHTSLWEIEKSSRCKG